MPVRWPTIRLPRRTIFRTRRWRNCWADHWTSYGPAPRTGAGPSHRPDTRPSSGHATTPKSLADDQGRPPPNPGGYGPFSIYPCQAPNGWLVGNLWITAELSTTRFVGKRPALARSKRLKHS